MSTLVLRQGFVIETIGCQNGKAKKQHHRSIANAYIHRCDHRLANC